MENLDGLFMRAINAGCVDHIVCCFMESDGENGDEFKAELEKNASTTMQFPAETTAGEIVHIQFKANLDQVPVLPNDATTGHKLQGQTKMFLFITDWAHGMKNWVCVALSRVTSRDGLFLGQMLKHTKRRQEGSLTKMTIAFRKRRPTPYEDDR